MNVLVDTNVLLSAALRDRLPERVMLYVAGRVDMRWLVTPDILAEYSDVLRRPKFGLDAETLGRWAELLAMRTINIGNPPRAPDFPRDPKDAPFLAAALAAHADFLITGDADLLDARDLVATRIVTPAGLPPSLGLRSNGDAQPRRAPRRPSTARQRLVPGTKPRLTHARRPAPGPDAPTGGGLAGVFGDAAVKESMQAVGVVT
jgi:uncharacterized protein